MSRELITPIKSQSQDRRRPLSIDRRRPLSIDLSHVVLRVAVETKLLARTLGGGGHGHHIFQADLLYQLAPALLQQAQAGHLN